MFFFTVTLGPKKIIISLSTPLVIIINVFFPRKLIKCFNTTFLCALWVGKRETTKKKTNEKRKILIKREKLIVMFINLKSLLPNQISMHSRMLNNTSLPKNILIYIVRKIFLERKNWSCIQWNILINLRNMVAKKN